MGKIRLNGSIQDKMAQVGYLHQQSEIRYYTAMAAIVNLRAGRDVEEVDDNEPQGIEEPIQQWVEPISAGLLGQLPSPVRRREGFRTYDPWGGSYQQALGPIDPTLIIRNEEQERRIEAQKAEEAKRIAEEEERIRKAQGIRPVRRFDFSAE